ncbi:unnamed protein product [uncultured bacterium]|nr:unnamed protein product [uncultured bacterium]
MSWPLFFAFATAAGFVLGALVAGYLGLGEDE